MTASFRPVDDSRTDIETCIDGHPVTLDSRRSLLANLLLLGRPAPFLCAIGHCQRCLVTVDGERVLACRTYLKGGEEVRT